MVCLRNISVYTLHKEDTEDDDDDDDDDDDNNNNNNICRCPRHKGMEGDKGTTPLILKARC
jgi:hypothetical protein